MTLSLLLLLSAQAVGAATNTPDPYLQQAFLALPPSWTVPGRARDLAARVREAALYGTWYELSEKDRTIPGRDALGGLAELLCDTDPRVRVWSARALHDWDRWESLPFLIGLLSDTGEWRPEQSGDFTDSSTVSASVAGLLDQDFVCDPLDRRRVSIHDLDDPLAVEHSMQRWYHAHMPYCLVTSERLLPVYYWYPMAAHFSIPPSGLQALRLVEPERFQRGLVPSLEILPGGLPVYAAGAPIPVELFALNYGTKAIYVRWNALDAAVHQFLLLDSHGRSVPLERAALPAAPSSASDDLSWFPAGASGLGMWWLDLARLFRIKRPGEYRFYYKYLPPKHRAKYEYGFEAVPKIWNGREYHDYFEFLVR